MASCTYPSVAAAAAKSLQSCPTLCDPIDSSPPGSSVPGILQTRTLEWAAISFSNAWKWKVKVKSLSRVQLLATPWTAAHQAPPSMGFSRQEYWSGVPLSSPYTHRSFLICYPLRIVNHCLLLRITFGKCNQWKKTLKQSLEGKYMPSEISQTEKDKYCLIWLICRV